MLWADEFNQAEDSAPDPANWHFDLGRGNPVGWGNNELETYTDSRENSRIASDSAATDGRVLVIRAVSTGTGYTSARLTTAGKFEFIHGRMEARLKMPTGRGLWPAFWALGSNITTVGWPACGEIDAMEWVGPALANGTVVGSLHAVGYSGGNPLSSSFSLPSPGSFSDAYHVFAVDRYPDRIIFSVDAIVYADRLRSQIPAGSQWPFDQPFHMLLNLAVGGNWPGAPDGSTVFPQEYRVDYVRVYDLPDAPPAGLVYPPSPPTLAPAGNTSPGRIQLTWSAPTDTFGAALTGYRLERATDAAFTLNLLTRTLGPVSAFTDKGLLAGTTYYYRLAAISNNGTSDYSATISTQLEVLDAGGTRSTRLLNVSTRAFVGTGENVAIVGFVIEGTETRRLLVRGVGPGLGPLGITNPLPDPLLTLFDQTTGALIASDDDWGSDGNAGTIEQSALATGAFALGSGSADAALVVDLPPGAYTAVIHGKNGGTGTALVESYEVPASPL